MIFDPVIHALSLPHGARVDQRVPKKLLVEQGAPTAADKRQIQDGIEELFWIAALKPTNIGITEFRDEVREYLEIAVLTVTLRAGAKPTRLIELIHRAIPYPLVLLASQAETISLSLAHKRWSQGEKGQVVIEDVRRTSGFRPEAPTAQEAAFLASLPLSALPAKDLFSLYQGWIDRIAALEASQITGTFAAPNTADQALTLREELDTHARLQREVATLRAQAAKEKQISRRVEMNLELKRLEVELARIAQHLCPESAQ
jgi:hypothetical protein